VQRLTFHRHHIEAAGRWGWPAQQEVLRGQGQAPLLDPGDAGAGATLAGLRTRAHLHEHQGAVGRAHDEVDLAAAPKRAARDPIIALHQRQTLGLQVSAGAVFGL